VEVNGGIGDVSTVAGPVGAVNTVTVTCADWFML